MKKNKHVCGTIAYKAYKKDRKLIKRTEPWLYFDDFNDFVNYDKKHGDPQKILLISKTIALHVKILSLFFFLVKINSWFQSLFHQVGRLIRYPLYIPAKIILPIIQIIGRAVYHVCYNRLSFKFSSFLRSISGRTYHAVCEITALVLLRITNIPFFVWFAVRFSIFIKRWIMPIYEKIIDVLRLFILVIRLFLAGRPSLLNLIPLFFKAAKIEQSGDPRRDVVKIFVGDYRPLTRKSGEIFFVDFEENPLYINCYKPNPISQVVENIDKGITLSSTDYHFLFDEQHLFKDIIETYVHLRRQPNPVAYTAILYLIHSLPQGEKLPSNPRIREINEEYRYFHKKRIAKPLNADYILIIPIGSNDINRIVSGKLSARILEAHLALTGMKLHTLIVLPVKSSHDKRLRDSIKNSLDLCFFPKNVSWEIQEPLSDVTFAGVRGASMIWALDYISNNKAVNDDTVVILSEMVGSAAYFNIRHLSQALKRDCVVTASRHIKGSRTINKSIPDIFNSRVYNTFTRIFIPGNCSDSSSPIKLFYKDFLHTLLPWIKLCAGGMLDFAFDEGFLSVVYNLGFKVIQQPVFWSDARKIGGAERTSQGIRAQLHYTKILSKKIRLLRQISGLKPDEDVFLGAGMDFSVGINNDLTLKKTPTKPLNSLEIMFSSNLKRTVNHNRFGLIGRLAMKILPDYISKRIGVVAEGRFRNPGSQIETLLAMTSSCPVVEETQLVPKENGFLIKQKLLPLLLEDIFKLNCNYNNTEGIQSILTWIIQFNKTLHEFGLFDGDIRTIKDTGLAMEYTWKMKLIDFADLVYRKEKVLQLTDNYPGILELRRDFQHIKRVCLSKLEWARLFFSWYNELTELFDRKAIITRWNQKRDIITFQAPVFQYHKDQWYIRNISLSKIGMSQMSDKRYLQVQKALFPPMETGFPIPESLSILPEWKENGNSSTTTIIFLSNSKTTISLVEMTMDKYLPGVTYHILTDESNESMVSRVELKKIFERYSQISGNIAVIALDGQSSRCQPIIPKGISHKAFLKINSLPLLYYITSSAMIFLSKKTFSEDLMLYLHGDTLFLFEDHMPKPALYIPKNICQIGRVLPKKSVNQNSMNSGSQSIFGKLSQVKIYGEGWELPGIFIIAKSMIPLLDGESSHNQGNFSVNIAKLTRHLKGIEYRIAPAFFDCDDPFAFFRLNLTVLAGKKCKKEIQYADYLLCSQNRIYISQNSHLKITSEEHQEASIELINIVVTEESAIEIVIPRGIKSARIVNAVFTSSTGKFYIVMPSVNGILAANFNGGTAELLSLSYYGVDGFGHPLCPELSNED